ncbi:hypothetical protein N657DRAFT_580845 [Parathielavia appendiculata]|uniref:5'-deoxynucleotidase n=1 Tax=Parathielavia appendiculata TaxID=2587402 RepID=A0AAN6TSL4_9PEZI|nr:hypothetical protein N657DRAFT_580845 [Parathielavia appendiculata]
METTVSPLDSSPLPFLHLIQQLKHLPRTGWLRTVENPESVASHSFRLALIGLFAPKGLDRSRCIFLGLCHDLAESVVGDIPTYAGVPKEQKYKLERSGFEYIESLVKPCNPDLAQEIIEAWLDYEEGRTPEGRWVKEMDKFECLTQAYEYEQRTYGEKDLQEFQGLAPKIQSPEGREWLSLLQAERKAHFGKRNRRVPVIFAPGLPSVLDDPVQQAFAADEAWLQCLFWESAIRERSEDPTFLHAKYLKHCLEQGLPVPTDLVVNILDMKIEEGARQDRWTLICGFPANMESLVEFQRKVKLISPLSKPLLTSLGSKKQLLSILVETSGSRS